MSLVSNNNHQICAAIVLSAVLLLTPHGTCARPDVGRYQMARQDVPPPQLLLNELLANANDDALYNELKKYHRQQPDYLSKWPGLRDLLLTAEYDENAMDSTEIVNSRFVERLRQLAANSAMGMVDDGRDENVGVGDGDGTMPEPLPTPAPLRNQLPIAAVAARGAFKDHGIKKKAQYMAPCHFKICNMGRKRNARYFSNYY